MLDHIHAESPPPLDDQAHEKDMLMTLVQPGKDSTPSADKLELETQSASTPSDKVIPEENATSLPSPETDAPLAVDDK